MSYRAFKHLLGETSLERKCRFLFGAGILLLITASFWLYAHMTESLAYEQVKTTGRLLVDSTVRRLHDGVYEVTKWRLKPMRSEGHPRRAKEEPQPRAADEWQQFRLAFDEQSEENLRDAVREYQYRIIKPNNSNRIYQPEDEFESGLLKDFLNDEQTSEFSRQVPSQPFIHYY